MSGYTSRIYILRIQYQDEFSRCWVWQDALPKKMFSDRNIVTAELDPMVPEKRSPRHLRSAFVLSLPLRSIRGKKHTHPVHTRRYAGADRQVEASHLGRKEISDQKENAGAADRTVGDNPLAAAIKTRKFLFKV